MRKLPLCVVLSGWLFIAAGVMGIVYHAGDFSAHPPVDAESIWTLLVRLLAIVGGVLVLRGVSRARWLLLGWMGYHVVISFMHSGLEVLIHCVLFAAVAFCLFGPRSSGYLRHPDGCGDDGDNGR
jgi:hypothetical protein